MMKRFWIVGLCCLGLGLLGVVDAPADQLVNGSFETGSVGAVPTGWTADGGFPPIIRDGGQFAGQTAQDGSKYVGEESAWTPDKFGGLYQSVAVNSGSIGTVSGYVSILKVQGGVDNVGWIGIDPTGGQDPASANIVWASYTTPNWQGWAQIETASVMATGSLVTVFLKQEIYGASNGNNNGVWFDDITLTGDLTDPAAAGTPPDVSNLSVVGTPNFPEVEFSYTLTDGEDGDTGATIAPSFRIGRYLDEASLPPEINTVTPFATSVASATDGNGIGTGAWRLEGQAGQYTLGDTDRNASTLVYQGLAPAGFTGGLSVKISDLERPLAKPDDSGPAIVLMTPDMEYVFIVGSFESPGGSSTALDVRNHWDIGSATGQLGLVNSLYNLEGSGLPEDGTRAIWFQIRRNSDNTLTAAWSRTGSAFNDFNTLDVTGTPLDLSQDLLYGFFINDGVIVNIEAFLSTFKPATNGTGGDGTTGLASTSSGSPHVFAWDADTDLSLLTYPPNLQLRIRATDDNGQGAADLSAFFQINLSSHVESWRTYR